MTTCSADSANTFLPVLPATSAETGAGTQLLADVLANQPLWDLVTSFMAGYPLAVHKFYQESDTAILQSACKKWNSKQAFLIGSLARRGVLPHLVIAANDPEMLRALFKLSKNPQYQRDPKLSFRKAMRCAVVFNHLDMLKCLGELKADDQNWKWEPNLMRLALQRDDPDLQVLDWLYEHLPRKANPIYGQDMLRHTQREDLDTVRWLHEHTYKIPKRAIDEAANSGQVEMLRYFYEHSGRRCREHAVNRAAELGYVDVVKLIVENQTRETTQYAMDSAASRGHLEVVKFLLESKARLATTTVVDTAAWNGHLDIVKYLHAHLSGGFTTHAMTNAAANGYLEIVEFLYENRAEGCSPNALDLAAQRGHLEVVKFLHDKYDLECPADAFDRAAAKGYLDMIAFLHRTKLASGTANAAIWAAKNGHYEIVKFLCDHNLEQDIASALTTAASRGHLDVVQFLLPRLEPEVSMYEAVEVAVRRKKRAVAKYLVENQEREPMSIVKQAVAKFDAAVVGSVWRYSSPEDLIDAQELAAELGDDRIVRILTHGTEVHEWKAKTRRSKNQMAMRTISEEAQENGATAFPLGDSEDRAPRSSTVRAGVAVLTNPTLFGVITGYSTGFPFTVHKFWEENDIATLSCRVSSPTFKATGTLVSEKPWTAQFFYNNIDAVECVAELAADDPQFTWSVYLRGIALEHENPDQRVLDWIEANLPRPE